MKLTLDTVANHYSATGKAVLEQYGFTFTECTPSPEDDHWAGDSYWIDQGLPWEKTDHTLEVDMDLEDVARLIEVVGSDVIFDGTSIQILDDYL